MNKSAVFITTFLFLTSGFGQTLFFDKLENSTWKSEAHFNETSIRSSAQIGLGKMLHPRDSLKVNVTLWDFKDSILTIRHYDCHLKKDSLVASFKFEALADKGTIRIVLNSNEVVEYEAGISSSGTYVQLTPKKGKKE